MAEALVLISQDKMYALFHMCLNMSILHICISVHTLINKIK